MFSPSQHDVRRFFCDAWRKQREGTPLTPLESLAADWITQHPEYDPELADVEAALGELAALGVECKGLDVGLVDFPAVVDGAPACLCWQLGEPAVAWWHRPEAGFAGRRPLAGADVATADAGAAEARP